MLRYIDLGILARTSSQQELIERSTISEQLIVWTDSEVFFSASPAPIDFHFRHGRSFPTTTTSLRLRNTTLPQWRWWSRSCIPSAHVKWTVLTEREGDRFGISSGTST